MSNLHLQLEAVDISSCPTSQLPEELVFLGRALQHQVDVFNVARLHDIILDLAPTGTGKTKAGLSVLLHNRERHAVYIAPTNALVEQQTNAARQFVQDAGLPHLVKGASARDIRSWPDDRAGTRPGEKIYNALREPSTIFPDSRGGRPLLLVTNPDIFYYATFFAYNKLDRGNIASEFYQSFSTVIFDEFHLYDAKQLVSLFFYLALSHVFGYFRHQRKVVLLTATPDPACEEALNVLSKEGVRIARLTVNEERGIPTPSQTSISLTLRKQLDKDNLIAEITQEVVRRLHEKPDQNGAVILDSKDTLGRISDRLRNHGLAASIGRITGDTPMAQRQTAAQKQVILATSTVDVGFNFERAYEIERQNLDWLIFSVRDRAAFWQRLGRVGRVLGKGQTGIPSEAVAYLPERAWEEGLQDIDCSGDRDMLRQALENLTCMNRPFLDAYWRSEAFLEIAKPLIELEHKLDNLPQEHLVLRLYQTLQTVLGGKREWEFYRRRMNVLLGAEQVLDLPLKRLQKGWKFVKGGQSLMRSFLREYCPEDFVQLIAGNISMEEVEHLLRSDHRLAEDLLQYARILKTSYAPIFHFRDSLFQNIKVYDPNGLLLDETGETNVDPIHLLRFYEFSPDQDRVVAIKRAEQPYNLSFSLHVDDLQEFEHHYLDKLYAFENCTIQRTLGGVIRPTRLLKEIEHQLIPGVIVREHAKNRWAIIKLKKQGLECFPISVTDYGGAGPKEYQFFPSLSGILALVSAGHALKSPVDGEFWVI